MLFNTRFLTFTRAGKRPNSAIRRRAELGRWRPRTKIASQNGINTIKPKAKAYLGPRNATFELGRDSAVFSTKEKINGAQFYIGDAVSVPDAKHLAAVHDLLQRVTVLAHASDLEVSITKRTKELTEATLETRNHRCST